MTVARLREQRSGLMASYPNGWGWSDPSAIPPPGMFSMQRAGVPVTAKTSLQVDVVFTALRVLSNAIIKMGNPRAYTEAYTDDNWPYREWMNPQPAILQATWGNMFQYDGMSRTVISMALFGEAFWYTLTRDRLGYPTALEVLHPAFITESKNKATGAQEWWYGTGTSKTQIPNEDLTHIPFMALPGAARGLNSIEYAGIAYALALAAMEYGQRWFSQGASPSFLLSTDQKLGQEEVKRIAEKFLIEHSGLQASHLPLVLDSGIKAEKISSTPDEAQYLNTLEYARSVIAAWFGLPAHLVGGNNDKGNVWGKRLDIATPLPTPEGWTTMGDVMPGTVLLGADGKPTTVTFATKIELAPESYRVRFNDGTSIDADAEHLWETTDYLEHTKVRTTREILDTLTYGARENRNHRIKVTKALQLPEAELPIDPYIMGYWLGDGSSAEGRLTVASLDLANLLKQIKVAGYHNSEPAQGTGGVWHLTVSPNRVTRGSRDSLVSRLRNLGALNNKHIPSVYLRASVEQRLALLQGLMDSDGNAVKSRARVEFTNKNEVLALGVLELARSLGLKPTIARYEHIASGKATRPRSQIIVGFNPLGYDVFRLARKSFAVEFCSKTSSALYRTVVAVEPIEPVEMRCIQVDNQDHLFLAGEAMVPTHNTVQEQGFQLVDFTLSGYVVRLNEAFSSLLPNSQFAQLNEEAITRANAEDLAKEIMANRTTGTETPNEIRVHKLHKRPLPGGDDLFTPLNSNTSPAVGTILANDLAKDEGIPAPAAVPDDAGGDNA
jgi:HK97 family phage portal protein